MQEEMRISKGCDFRHAQTIKVLVVQPEFQCIAFNSAGKCVCLEGDDGHKPYQLTFPTILAPAGLLGLFCLGRDLVLGAKQNCTLCH